MKFGSQILDKSVPEWKLNNIDYQQLKVAIRRSTTLDNGGANERASLEQLGRMFRSQFEMVNVFISMKLKECSTRIVSIENYLVQIGKVADQRRRLRRVKMINQHLDQCNMELQKLSRYLILQKIAIRKLFKKFVKHYPYGKAQAQAFVRSLKSCPELVQGHEGVSLLTVDLDPYLLEISLIVDLLHEVESKTHTDTQEANESGKKARRISGLNHITSTGSEEDAGSPGSLTSNGSLGTTGHNTTVIDSTLKFDLCFLSKFSPLGSFLVSPESIDESKFLLINLGFSLFDDSVIAASKKIRSGDTLLSKRKGSIQSLHLSKEPAASTAPTRGTGAQQNGVSCAGAEASTTSADSNSAVLYEPLSKPGTNPAELYLSTEETLYPNILYSYPLQQQDDCILQCHVGGLRNHIATESLSYSDIKAVLEGAEPRHIDCSNRLDEFCKEWCYSHNLKVSDFRIRCKRTRFVANRSLSDDSSNSYLLCIDDNIQVGGDINIPFALLQVHELENCNNSRQGQRKRRSKQQADPVMADIVEKLVNNNFSAFPADKSFTHWTLAAKMSSGLNPLYCIDRHVKFDSVDDLFEEGKKRLNQLHAQNQLHLNPPMIDFSEPRNHSNDSQRNDSPTLIELDKPRIHYWNEFDDGDEALDQDFYSYIDEDDFEGNNGSNDQIRDTGFISFTPSFIFAIYHLLSRFQAALGIVDDVQARKSLLQDASKSYNSINTDHSALTSSSDERNDVNKFWHLEEQSSESIYEFEHDQVISFFYVSSLLISCLTTGITLGIMTSLFKSFGDDDTELENETPILSMIFISLTVSLLLSGWSLLLLFSRFTFAPSWHYITGVLIFIIIIFAVCYGFIELIL